MGIYWGRDGWLLAYACFPQFPSAFNAGSISFPRAVREYSTRGGIS